MNTTSMSSGKGVLPIQTYYFNTPRAKIVSMASDPRKSALFILDSDSHSIYRMENFNIWVNDSLNIVPIQKGVSKTSAQIAYDWYNEMIYWVDGYYNWIGMQPAFTTDNSMYKIIIHKELRRPEGIAVDPISGYALLNLVNLNPLLSFFLQYSVYFKFLLLPFKDLRWIPFASLSYYM